MSTKLPTYEDDVIEARGRSEEYRPRANMHGTLAGVGLGLGVAGAGALAARYLHKRDRGRLESFASSGRKIPDGLNARFRPGPPGGRAIYQNPISPGRIASTAALTSIGGSMLISDFLKKRRKAREDAEIIRRERERSKTASLDRGLIEEEMERRRLGRDRMSFREKGEIAKNKSRSLGLDLGVRVGLPVATTAAGFALGKKIKNPDTRAGLIGATALGMSTLGHAASSAIEDRRASNYMRQFSKLESMSDDELRNRHKRMIGIR